MNKKFLNVLKYIGVACLGAFIGMGALIGVSSCYDNPKESKAEMEYYSYYDCWQKGINYYQITYHDSGLGVDGGRYIGDGFSLSIGHYGGWFDVSNCYINGNEIDRIYYGYDTSSFYEPGSNNFLYHDLYIWEISYRLSGTDNWLIGYQHNSGTSNIYNHYTFTLDSWSFGNSAGVSENEIGAWFRFLFNCNYIDNSYSSYTHFLFSDTFNYNGPYKSDIDNVVIRDSYFERSNANTSKYITYQFNEGFWCNGKWYESIRLTYTNAYGFPYVVNGEVKTGVTGQGYWSYMHYGYDDQWTLVASRKFAELDDVLYEQDAISIGVIWVNNIYKSIQVHNPSQTEQDWLAQFNSQLTGINNGFFTGGTNDAMINVFSMFKLAFSTWADILSIQLVPGITIGFLMFLPLVSGIIILIIWIVKR